MAQADVSAGQQALVEVFRRQPADLLIVDINMPKMDGFTFLKVLRRQDGPAASIPALVISTEAQGQDFEAARLAGANFYLVKPIAQDVLVDHVALLCGPPA